jgi:signal transduction histidine kinase
MRRLVWALAVSAAASLIAALIVAIALRPDPAGAIWFILIVPTPFLAAGTILLWQRPRHRAGPLLVGAVAGTMAYSVLLEQIIWARVPEQGVEPWMSVALATESLVAMSGLACFALLVGLFPECIPVTRGERRFAAMTWWLPAPMLLALLTNPSIPVEPVAYGGLHPVRSPLYVEALGSLGPATAPLRPLLGSVMVVALVMLLLRYRRVGDEERRQIRWVLYGSSVAVAVGMLPFVLGPIVFDGGLGHGPLLALSSASLVLIPTSMVVAITRPHWIDTDTVIRTSFAYGVLSFGVFAIYAALAAGLGLAAGSRLPVEVAIVVTVLLALLFQPARARLQRVADRWVFGERPHPLEAVAGFDETMRDAASDELPELLAHTVRQAARLRWVAVEIPSETFAAGRVAGDPLLTVPISHGGDEMGVIHCGPSVTGRLTNEDTSLIAALAGQAALVLSQTRLATRIVQAQEAERRRLERNLHDGAQQELVALVAKLGLARSRARRGLLDELALIELQRDAKAILADLRELAQGIHPSVLSDGGLIEAVEDRCARLPIDVAVDASPDLRHRRFGDEVEGAAYFFVAEGLANVLKHASANSVRVEVHHRDEQLALTVADDGIGFDPEAVGLRGLAGLADRLAALSGTVSVSARPGSGTVLQARLPVDAPT